MKQSFNPNQLQPGDAVKTLSGPAVFCQHKANAFRGQNYQVQLCTGKKMWYTADQLREANRQEQNVNN